MKVVIAYNSKAGGGLTARKLRGLFGQVRIDIEAMIDLTDDKAWQKLDAWKNQSKVVVAAVGGDGTLSSIAGVLAGTKAVFAPLPGGTLNHFTKDLGIPQDLKEALRNLKRAKPRLVDVATVNGKVFINNSSIGLYPATLRTRENLEGRMGKWAAAALAAVGELVAYRLYTVTINGTTLQTPFVFVGNNDYHLDMPTGRRDRLDRGRLSVYAVVGRSRAALVKIVFNVLIGRPKEGDTIKTWHVQEVTISIDRPRVTIARDGEIDKFATPLVYKIHRGMLRVRG